MLNADEKTNGAATPPDDDDAMQAAGEQGDVVQDLDAEIDRLTDKWKRALAEAENARKRADAARADGQEHGIAMAVNAFAPAFLDVSLGIKAAQAGPDADNPRIVAHLEGLRNIRAAIDAGLKSLGVKIIAPEAAPFDPVLHEAIQMQETADTAPGQVLVLHQPGFAIGQRLIRPALVTVSAALKKAEEK